MAAPEEEARNRPKGKSLRPLTQLVQFLRPYRGMLAAAGGALLIASGLMLALPVAGKFVIDRGFAPGNRDMLNVYFLGFAALIVVFCAFARCATTCWPGASTTAWPRSSSTACPLTRRTPTTSRAAPRTTAPSRVRARR